MNPDLTKLIVSLLIGIALFGGFIAWMFFKNREIKHRFQKEDERFSAKWAIYNDARDRLGYNNDELFDLRNQLFPEHAEVRIRKRHAEKELTVDELSLFEKTVPTMAVGQRPDTIPWPVPKSHVFTVGQIIIKYRAHLSIAQGNDDADPETISAIESKITEILTADPSVNLVRYAKELNIVIVDQQSPIQKKKRIGFINT